MKNVTNFITTYPVEVGITIVIIIALIVLFVSKKKLGMYATALYLVSVAEEEWGSKTGQIKFAQVITAFRDKYPVISLFIKENVIKNIIETALSEMREILTNKKKAEEDKALIK